MGIPVFWLSVTALLCTPKSLWFKHSLWVFNDFNPGYCINRVLLECDHFFLVLIEWKSSSVILIHIRGVFILNHICFLSKYLRSARADPRFMPRLSRIYIYIYIYFGTGLRTKNIFLLCIILGMEHCYYSAVECPPRFAHVCGPSPDFVLTYSSTGLRGE